MKREGGKKREREHLLLFLLVLSRRWRNRILTLLCRHTRKAYFSPETKFLHDSAKWQSWYQCYLSLVAAETKERMSIERYSDYPDVWIVETERLTAEHTKRPERICWHWWTFDEFRCYVRSRYSEKRESTRVTASDFYFFLSDLIKNRIAVLLTTSILTFVFPL